MTAHAKTIIAAQNVLEHEADPAIFASLAEQLPTVTTDKGDFLPKQDDSVLLSLQKTLVSGVHGANFGYARNQMLPHEELDSVLQYYWRQCDEQAAIQKYNKGLILLMYQVFFPGTFKDKAQNLGVNTETAKKMKRVAVALTFTALREHKELLLKLGWQKLSILLRSGEERLAELCNGNKLFGLTLPDIASMTTRELDIEIQGPLQDGRDKKIARLEQENTDQRRDLIREREARAAPIPGKDYPQHVINTRHLGLIYGEKANASIGSMRRLLDEYHQVQCTRPDPERAHQDALPPILTALAQVANQAQQLLLEATERFDFDLHKIGVHALEMSDPEMDVLAETYERTYKMHQLRDDLQIIEFEKTAKKPHGNKKLRKKTR